MFIFKEGSKRTFVPIKNIEFIEMHGVKIKINFKSGKSKTMKFNEKDTMFKNDIKIWKEV